MPPLNSENIWKHIKFPKDPTSCWIWLGRLSPEGYGKFSFDNKEWLAHRFIYQYLMGKEIPKGLVSDHLCRNRACVNPDHLEFVTIGVNINRGDGNPNKKKTHCKFGHPFDEKNTYYYQEGIYPKRKCKLCLLFAKRRFRKKQKLMVLNV